MKEQDEYDALEYRYLNTRAKRAPSPKKDEPSKADDKPEIHVHVAMPEVKDAPKAAESPRRWKFTHKYDVHNKLTETIAEAE